MAYVKFVDANWRPYESTNWLDYDDVEILQGFEEQGPTPDISAQLTGTVKLPKPWTNNFTSSTEAFEKLLGTDQPAVLDVPLHTSLDVIEAMIKTAKKAITVRIDTHRGNTRDAFEYIHKLHLGFPGNISLISPPVSTAQGVTYMLAAGCQAVQIQSSYNITSLLHARRAINSAKSNASLIATVTKSQDIPKAIAAGANICIPNNIQFINSTYLIDTMKSVGARTLEQLTNKSEFMEVSHRLSKN